MHKNDLDSRTDPTAGACQSVFYPTAHHCVLNTGSAELMLVESVNG